MRSRINQLNTTVVYGSAGYANAAYQVDIPNVYDAKNWEVTPGFFVTRRGKTRASRVSPVILATCPYEHYQYRIKIPTQQIFSSALGFTNMCYGNWSVPNVWHPSAQSWRTDECYQACLNKIMTRLNGANFNLPLFLAEGHKTIEMFHKMVHDLSKFATKGVKPSRKLRDMWLEYRYGWRLLAKDIYDSLCAIHDARLNGVTTRIKVRHEVEGSFDPFTYAYGTSRTFEISDFRADTMETVSYKAGASLTVYYRNDCPFLGTLQQFGITNPLSLVYELIPGSFILDWSLNVGNYLAGLDIWIGKSFRCGSRCDWSEFRRSCKPVNLVATSSWVATSVIFEPTEIYERSFKRTPLLTFPTADLPSPQLNLNWKRVLDGVSILSQIRDNRLARRSMPKPSPGLL